MTTVMDESVFTGNTDQDPTTTIQGEPLPDASVLEDKTPPWFRMPLVSVIFTALIGLIFLQMAFTPLWHTDLWDHINYGQQVLTTGKVSTVEPLLQLSQGVPMVNFPWLTQVAMAWTYNNSGLAALQFAAAACVAAMMALVAWRGTQRGGSVCSGLIAVVVFFALNRYQFMVVRPQLVGLLFYVITVVWSQAKHRHTRLTWIAMPVMFALWANCHGSFSVGLTLMALTGAGRFVDIWLRSRSIRTAFLDHQFDQTFLLTQLCATAVLLNPAGLAVYREVLQIANNPNIQSMFEWFPLTLRTIQGQWAAAMILLLVVSIRLSPRRIRFVEMLPVIFMGLMAFWSSRMINWWAPLMGITIGVHAVAAARHLLRKHRRTEPYPTRGLWTVINLGMCWILFAFTHFGVQTVHGRTTELAKLVSSQTPIQLVDYLNSKKNLPNGIALVPAEWAGFVMNAGPKTISPMVNLHVHVIPPEVWGDYERLVQGPSDWEPLLEQYGINLAIVDKMQQPRLLGRLGDSDDWTPRYQDNLCVVFTRNKPI